MTLKYFTANWHSWQTHIIFWVCNPKTSLISISFESLFDFCLRDDCLLKFGSFQFGSFQSTYDRLWASVMRAVPKLDESENGQMVSEKVKLTYFDVYLSQTMWNHTTNSMIGRYALGSSSFISGIFLCLRLVYLCALWFKQWRSAFPSLDWLYGRCLADADVLLPLWSVCLPCTQTTLRVGVS